MNWFTSLFQKNNPAQIRIRDESGWDIPTDTYKIPFDKAFNSIEVVNRGVSMIVNDCVSLDFDIKESYGSSISKIRPKALWTLLNVRPNPYQSINDFRKNVYTDFLLAGDAFIYFDGAFIYHLPSTSVTIQTDPITFISSYKYDDIVMGPDEVLSFKDINSDSVYRGASRLKSAQTSINTLASMLNYQNKFFANSCIPGLIFTTDSTLSTIAKTRTTDAWAKEFNPSNGKKPMILDSGLKPSTVVQTSFTELEYTESIKVHTETILKALGIPPVLLDSGNNSNISPNLRLYYLETVVPIVRAFSSALERFFGYNCKIVLEGVSALQPELREQSAFLSTLVNSGIMTPNEARESLRLPKDPDPINDQIRVPQNIAGSAVNPTTGGRPPDTEPQ